MSADRLTRSERLRGVWECECPACGAEPGHACARPRSGRGHHRERFGALGYLTPAEVRRLLANPAKRAPTG